jgi:hypothetical protein
MFCSFCSAPIALADFEKGLAVRLLGKIYCSDCQAVAIENSRNPEARPELTTPRPFTLVDLGKPSTRTPQTPRP